MHEHFADWFRPVRITSSKELLAARHSAASAVATAVRKHGRDALPLVTTAFANGPLAVPSWLNPAVKKADPTLLLHDNDHELRVIIAAGLALFLEDRRYDSGAMANAVRCASLMGTRRPSVEIPLADIADGALRHWSRERRRTARVADHQAPKLDRRKLDPLIAAVAEGAGWQAPADATKALADAVDASFGSAMARVTEGMRQLEAQVDALREESALVWWAVGGWARSLDRAVADMAGAEVPLIVGMEISRHVALQPSPMSLLAVLGRALLCRDGSRRASLPLATAIEGLSPALRTEWLEAVPDGHLRSVAPLTEALARAARDGANWRDGFERATGVDPNVAVEPELLALQACEEHLLPVQFD